MKRFWALIIVFVIGVFAFCIECGASQILGVNNRVKLQIENNDSNEVLEFDVDDFNSIVSDLDLEIHSSKQIADRKIVEGYSSKLKDYVVINGLRVNVQMSITDEKIVLGYPLISGSF